MNYQSILDSIQEEIGSLKNTGKVATYIPELGKVGAHKFGLHLQCVTGEHFALGDAEERFSIQSISKVISLSYALKLVGNVLMLNPREILSTL